MLRGYFGAIENLTEVTNCQSFIVFLISGGMSVGEKQITGGRVAAFFDSHDEISAGSDARGLIVFFGDGNFKNELASHGLKSGEDFAFSSTHEFEDFAKCFFGAHKTYENAIFERGIADIMISFVSFDLENCKKSEFYIAKAEQYIDENLHLPIRIDEIADMLFISRGYLRNLFFAQKGVSPREYLTEKRITRAKELLFCGAMTVSDVAFAVGYEDVLGFSRIFKKHVGCSPKEYRKEFANIHENAIVSVEKTVICETAEKEEGIQREEIIRKEEIVQKEEALAPKEEIDVKEEISAAVNEKHAADEAPMDLTAILAAQIEAATVAARAEEERKNEERAAGGASPFWLL